MPKLIVKISMVSKIAKISTVSKMAAKFNNYIVCDAKISLFFLLF